MSKQKFETPIEASKKEKYFRNRPFLIVDLTYRPEKSVKTEVKGWMQVTGNLETFEQPYVVDRVNATHLRNAAVIIDVIRGECVKNQYIDTPRDEVVKHYMTKYQSQITEATEIWLSGKVRAQANKVSSEKSVVDGAYSIG